MLAGMLAGGQVARESFRKTHKLRIPRAEDNPTGKAEGGTADRDNGPVALAKARMGGGVWFVGCVHRCESVQKGEATGGAGEEPADQKRWRWGPALCFNTRCR